MSYAELSFFDGYHFAHIAAYEEVKRLNAINTRALRFIMAQKRQRLCERRFGSRRLAA